MILISSFYNEAYLLPWWLEHHKKKFKHGVLYDYYSTDRSVEIIKEICPTWEIRKTKNKDWDFADNDREWMEAEQEFQDYKIILTTTEFLIGHPKLPKKTKNLFGIPMIRMVDIDPNDKPTYDKPLVEQKNIGFPDRSANKNRFLHNYPDGQYGTGRHTTPYKIQKLKGVTIYKYIFSPWTEEFIDRKLSMKKHMSLGDKEKGLGRHHTWELEKLIKKYNNALKKV